MTLPCMANANPPSLVPGRGGQERQLSLPEERPGAQSSLLCRCLCVPPAAQGLGVLAAPALLCKHTSSGVPEVRVKGNPSLGISCLYYL